MSNTVSFGLGLSVLVFLSLDYAFNNSDNFIFLAHEFIIFIDLLAVWR
jgi:hypothetical protein